MSKNEDSAPGAHNGYQSYETMTREQMISEIGSHLTNWGLSVSKSKLTNYCAIMLDKELITCLDLMRDGVACRLVYLLAPGKE